MVSSSATGISGIGIIFSLGGSSESFVKFLLSLIVDLSVYSYHAWTNMGLITAGLVAKCVSSVEVDMVYSWPLAGFLYNLDFICHDELYLASSLHVTISFS